MNDGYPVPQPYSRAGLLAKLTGAAVLAAGALLHGQGTALLATLPLGSAGRVLVACASAPAWSDSGLSYASGVLTVAGSVPGTPAAGQVFVGGGAVKAGTSLTVAGTVTLASQNLTVGDGAGSPTIGIAGPSASARAIIGYTGVSALANRRWFLYLGNTDAESGANAGSAAALLARDDAGNGIDTVWKIFRAAGGNFEIYRPLLCTGVVSVPDGTAAAPGIRLTTYTHGLFAKASSALGFAAAGVEVGRADYSAGWSFFVSVNTAGSAASANRSVSTGAASAIYNGLNATFADTSAATGVSYFSSAYRGILNITGNGDNNGYDRGITFEAYHRGNGTRAAVTGAFIEVGTYNGGSDSTGTISTLTGIKLQALKTTSSTVTTGVLLDLGAGVGSTKYAIRSTSGSGIVSIGDTTTAGVASGALVCIGGGYFGKAVFSNNDASGVHYYANSGLTMRDLGSGTSTYLDLAFGSASHGAYSIRSSNAATVRFNIDTSGHVTLGGAAGNYLNINNATGELRINGTKVMSARKTGWTAATGTATRSTFDTATVTLPQLAERVKAALDDLMGLGAFGT